MADDPTEEQLAAWERFKEAKQRADRTLVIADGIAAITAWKVFANLFLPDDRQLPLTPPRQRNVTTFPIHKTRAPGDPSRPL